MIRNLIFDFGAVLLDWNPHYLYDPYFGSVEKADWFLEHICTMEWNTQQDAGRPFAEGVAQRAALFPEWEKEIRMYAEQWPRMMNGEIPGMRAYLEELKTMGYRLFGLTNWSAETFPNVRNYPILKLLEGYIVSGEEKVAKPDPRFYRILLERYGLKPEECLFIDDNPANVAGAEAVGIRGLRFTGLDKLRKDLDAQRCLLCKNARCSGACPVRTDVPEAMRLYREGRTDEAARLLFANNPLSALTCQVCDWNRLCFGHCILNARKMPIHWYLVEQEISLPYLEQVRLETAPDKGREVSVVGAGPAGIAAAIFLRQQGFGVTLYDAHPRMGGVLRYGIPPFRLDRRWVDAYERILLEAGVRFRGGVRIGRDLSLEQLCAESDAVLVAGGAEKARRMRIPGEDLPCVIPALQYLESPASYDLGRKVIVVGGGNVAMDACRTAVRSGAETWVYYRKTFENMPANSLEVEEAKAEGVRFAVFQVPVSVSVREGRGVAVVRDCENVTGPDGGIVTRIIDGSDHEVDFDTLIIAVSESVDYSLFGDDRPGTDEKGWLQVNGRQQTSREKIFLAGDFLSGPRTVVQAVQSAKIAVQGIAEYLK